MNHKLYQPISKVLTGASSIADMFGKFRSDTISEPILPLDVSDYSDLYMGNPYDLIDGQWGGMGAKTWYHNQERQGLPKLNVYEYSDHYKCWVRVWDHGRKKWRELTKREIGKLNT